MARIFSMLLLCLLLGAGSLWAAGNAAPAGEVKLSPEDCQVVAAMEILELLDLVEEMDMIQDINYLIEEDQNDDQTD